MSDAFCACSISSLRPPISSFIDSSSCCLFLAPSSLLLASTRRCSSSFFFSSAVLGSLRPSSSASSRTSSISAVPISTADTCGMDSRPAPAISYSLVTFLNCWFSFSFSTSNSPIPVVASSICLLSSALAFKNAAKSPCASRIERLKALKSMPSIRVTASSTDISAISRPLFPFRLLVISSSVSFLSNFTSGLTSPFLLRLARHSARYCVPSAWNTTSEKPSLVPWLNRLTGLLLPVPSNRGVRLYRATDMASSRVVLPEPVGPVMANKGAPDNGSVVKSRWMSFLKLLIFFRRRDRSFKALPPAPYRYPAVR